MTDDNMKKTFLENEENDADDAAGEVIILEKIKKKGEARRKKLNSIYMSYEILDFDKIMMNGHVNQDEQNQNNAGSKGNKMQRLNEAVMSLDYTTVTNLLAQRIGIDVPNRFGRCPIHNAILKGDYRIVKMVLEANADVTMRDDRGDMPLHYAVRTGSEQITKELLQHPECDVNAEGSTGATPLHIAASLDKPKICKLLLEHMGRIDCREEFGKTPLGTAMESGAHHAAKYLLEFIKKMDLDMETFLSNADKEGSTLLHLAVDSGFVKVVKLCLEYGATIRQPKHQDRSTAFHLACEQGSVSIAKLLLQHDPGVARILLIDSKGATPLHNAARNNSSALLELLLEHGADANARDDINMTPLMVAASLGAADSVQLLMDKGADPTIKNIDGRTAIYNGIGHGHVTEILLTSKQLVPLLIEKDTMGFAPPHHAAKRGDLKSMQLFLENNKAAAHVTSDSLATPLHVAAKHGWHEVVNALLEKQGGKIVNLQDTRARTALHYAASGGHHRATALLLQYAATIEKDQNDRTALHEAARKGSRKVVEMIVEKREHCLNFVDDEKDTALHLAAIYQHAHIVTYLLSAASQEILLNSSNQNILDIALQMNCDHVVSAIVEHPRWREVLLSGNSDASGKMITLIEKMPRIAERLLDHCMQTEGNRFSPKYQVNYDLSLILSKEKSGDKSGSLKILKCMAEYRRDRCLTHPLCFVVLSTKWKRFGCPTFLLNLLFFMALLLPLTYLHVVMEENDNKYCADRVLNHTENGEIIYDLENTSCNFNYPLIHAIQLFIVIMIAIQLLKETIQCYYQRMRYFTSVSSWMDVFGCVAGLLSVVPPCDCKWGFQKEMASMAIFVSWINLIMYFRRLPFYGKYVIMLYCMFVTMLKVLVLFAFFIMAFGSTFYLILDQEPFTSLPNTLMNMFIMTLGEINYVDVFMPWSNLYYPVLVNVVLVLFCLTMPIILMNMLVGLAVGDIDQIEKNALIDRYIMQVEFLIDIEAALPSWLLRRFHFSKVTDFPNKKSSILLKVYDSLIGFGIASEDNESDERTDRKPDMTQVTERLDEQASEIENLHNTLTTVLKIVREQTETLEKLSKVREPPLESDKLSIKPTFDFLGSVASTAFSFGSKKEDDQET